MDTYGVAGAAYAPEKQSLRDQTPLGSIADHANTASRIGDLIEQFIGRFHNNPKQDGDCADGLKAVTFGHGEQLARLEKNLARAEELARQLASIG